MEIILIILFVSVLSNLNIFFRLFLRENKSRSAYSFMFYSFFMTLWPLSMFCMNIKKPYIQNGFFEFIHPLLWLPIGFLTLWFVYEFIKKKKDEIFYIFFILTSLVTVLQIFTSAVQGDVYNSFIGRDLSTGPFFIPVVITVIIMPLFYSIILLRKHCKSLTSAFLKKQVNTIFFALLFCAGFGVLIEVLIPNIIRLENTPNLSPVILPFIVIIIFHSLNRYEFLLKESDIILKQVFSIVKKGLIVLDNLNNVLMKNKSAENLLNIDPEILKKILEIEKKTDVIVIAEEPFLVIRFNLIHIHESQPDGGKVVIIDDITSEYKKRQIIREKNDFLIKRIEKANYQRVDMEKQMQDIRKIYEFVFNNDIEGMFLVNVDQNKIIDLNNRIIDIYSLKDEKEEEKKAWLLKEFDDVLNNKMLSFKKEEKRVTLFRKRKDGKIFPAEFTFSYYSSEDSKCCLVCLRDLTERLHSEKMLVQAERIAAIGSVAGGMAHEFNNLHTIISGNIELIQKKHDLIEEDKKALDEVISISRSVSGKTKEILEFSRQEKYFFKVISLKKHIDNIFEIINRQCDDYGITIKKDFSDDIRVKVIPGNITQVIMNMILFSIYNLHDCSVRNIEISLKKEDDKAIFIIEDSGVRFDPAKIQGEKITEINHDNDEKREIHELILSGLGWKVSEMIAAENGGRLEYLHKDDKNRFVFLLTIYEEVS